MRIGIEMRQVVLGKAGGISLLLKGVLEALFRLDRDNEYFGFCTVFNRGLLERGPERGEIMTLPAYHYMAEVNRLSHHLNLDVLFRAYPVEHDLTFPLNKQIFLIPDIQHEYYPEFFDAETLRSRRVAFTQALAGAGAIGTISEYARQTLLDQECTHCRDIFLMSPALQEEHRQASLGDVTAAERELVPANDYFLYPANLWQHKNHRRVLQAFARFLEKSRKPMTFVCTGHPGGWPAIQADFPNLPVRHIGFVRAPLMRLLLSRARALAFFSLYEGFGMPLLEAFDVGTPVICSNTTSLPEVGGDAVLDCDPTDPEAMADLMARIAEDDRLRIELVARGQRRLRLYTWEQSAQNLRGACERVAAPEADGPRVCVSEPPLVSIVTPSYNQGRFLRRTIESVLNQTYPHIEYLVMDGGSTDESVEVLRSYGDRFPWVSEPDRGQTHAINKGFARTRGVIRAYLNSDDVLLPDGVEKAVAHFQSHPGCDMVYGNANYINEHDEVTGTYNTAEYSFGRLMQDCCVCQPAAFWLSRIARRVGTFNEALHYVMDYDYWLRIDRAGGRIEHVHDVLACSRLYPETKTLSGRYKIYQEIFEVCRRHAGYVDIGFFHGFWHHLCRERDRGLPRRLCWLPRFQPGMAYLHHKWWNRHRYSASKVLAGVGRRLRRLVSPPLGPFTSILTRLQRQGPLSMDRGRWVSGFWPDNWIGPTLQVVLKDMTPGRLLHVAGMANQDMTLTVLAGDRIVANYPLRGERYEKVCFPLAPEFGNRLCLKFSRTFTDAAQRRLSFLLQDTNLFSEQDLY